MSTPLPPPPRTPTYSTEPEAPIALRDLCAELRASLDKTAELCGKVATEIARVSLAEYATEHRLNVLQDFITDGLMPRLERLEAVAAED